MKQPLQTKQIIFNNGAGCPALTIGNVQPVVTLSQRTDAVLRGLSLVLRHHLADEAIVAELSVQLHNALDTSSDEMVWLKRIKYALTYPLSKYLRNPLPPRPDQVFNPTGGLRRWMKARLHAFNRKNTHLWYSWLQCKRSSLPASEEIVEESYTKHLATLTKADPGDTLLIDKILDQPDFKFLLADISREVANKMTDTEFTELSASGSACFEFKRSQGGQQAHLHSLCFRPYKTIGDTEIYTDLSPSELWSMDFLRTFGDDGVEFRTTERRCAPGFENWQSLRWLSNDLCAARENGNVNIKCTIQAILEPMKIRVISKGESLPYYSCRPLQKAIHSSLRGYDCFRLVGRPFSPTDMLDLAELAGPDNVWFSIDYSAATDGLSWYYSGEIFKRIIAGIPEGIRRLALDVLGPHELHYPVEGGPHIEWRGTQRNGQLMGSILSFPILCLANLGVYLYVTRKEQQLWSRERRLRHVLVNGDDMLYNAPRHLWDKHTNISGRVGLEMSVGKAYMHPVYANVNSTSVHFSIPEMWSEGFDSRGEPCHIRNWHVTPWQIDYLNVGLFYGQHKVQGTHGDSVTRRKDEDDEDLCERSWGATPNTCDTMRALKRIGHGIDEKSEGLLSPLPVILKGCLPGKQVDILKQFLSCHKVALRKECLAAYCVNGHVKVFTRNMFLPVSLGGFGIVPPIGFKYLVKPIQQKIAEECIIGLSNNGRIKLSRQHPLPGFEVETVEPMMAVPWSREVAPLTMYKVRSQESRSQIYELHSHQAIRYDECRTFLVRN